MLKRNYKGFTIVIAYMMILRIVLNFTIGINFFSWGTIFDLILVMFWFGAVGFFMKTMTAQKIFYIVLIVIASAFVIGDSIYFDYFDSLFSRSALQGVQWLAEGNTIEYAIHIPIVVYIVTPLAAIFITLIVRLKEKDRYIMKEFLFFSIIFVIQCGLFLFWGNQSFDTRLDYYRSDAYLFESMYDRPLYSEKYGYFNYHAIDFTRIRQQIDTTELFDEVDEFYQNRTYEHTNNEMTGVYQNYNVITILGETLDTRFIDEILTPNLYMMSQNGITFDNYYTTVFQQGATCNSEYMSLTGMSAMTTNDWSNNICDAYAGNEFPYALPHQLEDIGYDTYYFHSGYEWFYNRKNMVPSYGFETVKFQEDLYAAGYDDFYDRFDTNMLDFYNEYVDFSNPFYIDMLTYSMHGGYNQEEFKKYDDTVALAHPGEELNEEIQNYMEKLVEFDTMLGMIIEKLQDEGVYDNTLFVIYPDHYPYMMSSNVYQEYIGIANFYEIQRQELIIYATNITPRVVSTTGSTMDITPTVLNMVHPNPVYDYFIGEDLFISQDRYVLFSDLTITDGENYLYLNQSLAGDDTLYPVLEAALEEHIYAYEIQKKLLNSNYFRLKEEE